MEKLQAPSIDQLSCSELLLVDDQMIIKIQEDNEDLYDLLAKEPILMKQESIKYDYRPNLATLFINQQNWSEGTQESHGQSQKSSKCSKARNHTEKNTPGSIQRSVKCKCSKTKCQKNYCDCFKAGLACTSDCSCADCCNDEKHHAELKLKKSQGTGCKCQKSKCSKNYCQCHNGGKKCGSECRCIQCNNMEIIDSDAQYSQPRKRVKLDMQIPYLQLVGKASFQSYF